MKWLNSPYSWDCRRYSIVAIFSPCSSSYLFPNFYYIYLNPSFIEIHPYSASNEQILDGGGKLSSPKGEIILKVFHSQWTTFITRSSSRRFALRGTQSTFRPTQTQLTNTKEGREWKTESIMGYWCTLAEACVEVKLHWGGVCLAACTALGQTCQNGYVNDANDVSDAREALHYSLEING